MNVPAASPVVPVVWRPLLGRIVPHGLLPVVAAILAGLGYILAPSVGSMDMALFLLLALPALALLYLAGRPHATAHEHGLTVVNMLGRRELEWSEVIGACMPEGEPWPTLDLSDGTTLAMMGIQTSDGTRARRHFAQLRTLLDRHSFSDVPTLGHE